MPTSMSKRILIVEDEPLLCQLYQMKLTNLDYQVTVAHNGMEGYHKALEFKPDLILLDIGLPGMDGLEAVRHFQKEIDVPVIFVSARRRELDTILGLELGADDYITKPFNPDVLLAHVKAVLRRSARQSASTRVAELLRTILPVRVQAHSSALEPGAGAMGGPQVQAVPQTQAQGVPLAGERCSTFSQAICPMGGWRDTSYGRMVRAG